MADVESITLTFAAILRQVTFRGWGGIGCRVSFFVMVALVLAVALVGAFFSREGGKTLDMEIRGRAMYVARELTAFTADDSITGNRFELYKKLTPPFAANEEILSGGSFLFLKICKHHCDLLIGSTPTEVFFDSDSYYYTLPDGRNANRDDAEVNGELTQTREPYFVINKHRVYDLSFPVIAGNEKAGFVQAGFLTTLWS